MTSSSISVQYPGTVLTTPYVVSRVTRSVGGYGTNPVTLATVGGVLYFLATGTVVGPTGTYRTGYASGGLPAPHKVGTRVRKYIQHDVCSK
jgi:hypothetical protein